MKARAECGLGHLRLATDGPGPGERQGRLRHELESRSIRISAERVSDTRRISASQVHGKSGNGLSHCLPSQARVQGPGSSHSYSASARQSRVQVVRGSFAVKFCGFVNSPNVTTSASRARPFASVRDMATSDDEPDDGDGSNLPACASRHIERMNAERSNPKQPVVYAARTARPCCDGVSVRAPLCEECVRG